MLIEAVFVRRVVFNSPITIAILPVPLIAQALAACLHLECGIALRHVVDISRGVGIACVVGGLDEDVGLAVSRHLDVRDADDAHLRVADRAAYECRSVRMIVGIRRGQRDGRPFCVDGLVHSNAAVFADMPVSCAVHAPCGADV